MKKIIKVIFEDKSEITNDINDLDYKVLQYLDDEQIEEYAVYHFDLINEDDVEKNISDFSDAEILEECSCRELSIVEENIMISDLLNRFHHVCKKDNFHYLDSLIADLEIKNGLI